MLLSSSLYEDLKDVVSINGEFSVNDSQDDFTRNKNRLSTTWRYATKQIIYKSNSLGYRTEELEFYKEKEFILVLGCSHTQGTALADDEVWHYQLKKKFGCEILNAGLSGTGTDIQLLNSYLFLVNSNLKPKAVVIQWPNCQRFTFKGNSEVLRLIPNLHLVLSIFNPFFEQSIMSKFYHSWVEDNNSLNHSQVFIELTRLLWRLSKIPYHDFTIDDNKSILELVNINDYTDLVVKGDLARDLLHYGYKTHEAIGLKVCEELHNEFN